MITTEGLITGVVVSSCVKLIVSTEFLAIKLFKTERDRIIRSHVYQSHNDKLKHCVTDKCEKLSSPQTSVVVTAPGQLVPGH